MTTIYLIRHGETAWNAEGRIQGHQNVPLNEAGRAQARVVADAMAVHHLDALYTSDLARSAETAAIVAAPHGRTPIADARLRETSFGSVEGCTWTEIAARFPDFAARWHTDTLNVRAPGGETMAEAQVRVGTAFAEILARHPSGTICIVAHGGAIRGVIATVLGVDLGIFPRLRLDNAGITTVRHRDGRLTLVGMNDICHFHQGRHPLAWDESGDVGVGPGTR